MASLHWLYIKPTTKYRHITHKWTCVECLAFIFQYLQPFWLKRSCAFVLSLHLADLCIFLQWHLLLPWRRRRREWWRASRRSRRLNIFILIVMYINCWRWYNQCIQCTCMIDNSKYPIHIPVVLGIVRSEGSCFEEGQAEVDPRHDQWLVGCAESWVNIVATI